MLQSLRLDPVVGGNRKQGEIDPGRAGQHCMDEALMPRHVDEAEYVAVASVGR